MKVGATTETEMKENKHRVEDALRATRAALGEGIVLGGGIALLQAANAIRLDRFQKQDEKTGAKIALRASNSRFARSRTTPVSRARSSSTTCATQEGAGIDAITSEIVDLVAAGVIDPATVTRSGCRTPPRSPRTSSPCFGAYPGERA